MNVMVFVQIGKSLTDVTIGGCSFETLRLDALVDRCFDHHDKKTQHLDQQFAAVATNCIIKYAIYLPSR